MYPPLIQNFLKTKRSIKMYRAFYQLTKQINRKDIFADDLFKSENFKEAVSRLEFMKDKGGFTIVSGDCGVGKTTVLRYFVEKLNQRFYKIAYAPLATVSVLDFYRQIAFLLTGTTPFRKDQLFRLIQSTIMEMAVEKKTIPIIIFDDAQFLSTNNFFELQLLSNFNFDSLSPALFILIAQPHLINRLRKPAFDSFYQRIKIHIPIQPLSKNETSDFISHIMTNVSSSIDLFTQQAIELIYDESRGVIRKTTKVIEQALIYGAANNLKSIDEQVIHKISLEL